MPPSLRGFFSCSLSFSLSRFLSLSLSLSPSPARSLALARSLPLARARARRRAARAARRGFGQNTARSLFRSCCCCRCCCCCRRCRPCRCRGECAAMGARGQHRPPVATVVSVAGPGSPAFSTGRRAAGHPTSRAPASVAKERQQKFGLLNPGLGSRNTGPNKKVGLNGAQRWHGRPHGDALRLGSTERRSTHRDAPVLQLPGAAVATSRRARASSPRSGGRHFELRP
jgi:hypothetical protein